MVSFISVCGLVSYFECVSMFLHYGALSSGCAVFNSRLLALKGVHSLSALCCNNGSNVLINSTDDKKKKIFISSSGKAKPWPLILTATASISS